MAVADRAITGIFRQSFALLRGLSTSASPPAPSSSAAGESKPKRRKKKNLFDVIQFLPNWGIGYKVAKTHWQDVSYELTKINLYKVLSSAPPNPLFSLPSPFPPQISRCLLYVWFYYVAGWGIRYKAWGIRYKAGESKRIPFFFCPLSLVLAILLQEGEFFQGMRFFWDFCFKIRVIGIDDCSTFPTCSAVGDIFYCYKFYKNSVFCCLVNLSSTCIRRYTFDLVCKYLLYGMPWASHLRAWGKHLMNVVDSI